MGWPGLTSLGDCGILLQDEQIHSCSVHWTYLRCCFVGADGAAFHVPRSQTGAGHPNFISRDEIGAGRSRASRRARQL